MNVEIDLPDEVVGIAEALLDHAREIATKRLKEEYLYDKDVQNENLYTNYYGWSKYTHSFQFSRQYRHTEVSLKDALRSYIGLDDSK